MTKAGYPSYARIDLDTKNALLDALELHKSTVYGRRIMVQPYAQFKARNEPTGKFDDRKVVIYGIDGYWTSKDVGELFAGSCDLIDCHIPLAPKIEPMLVSPFALGVAEPDSGDESNYDTASDNEIENPLYNTYNEVRHQL